MVPLDPVSRAIVDVIRDNGYTVEVMQDQETFEAVATHSNGETHTVTGDDPYLTICRLAERVGIELDDG